MVVDSAGGGAREVWHSNQALEGSLPRTAGEDILNWAGDGELVSPQSTMAGCASMQFRGLEGARRL
jgi:hypothetical protein